MEISVTGKMSVLTFEYSISRTFAIPQLMGMPLIDQVPLVEIVRRFEAQHGWDGGMSYGGLIPLVHCYGSVEEYFEGLSRSTAWNGGKTALLACDCGQITCWPLMARIVIDTALESEVSEEAMVDSVNEEDSEFEADKGIGDVVVWSDFEQPHRRERDYSGLGPFRFVREPYVEVLRELEIRVLESRK